MKKARVLLVAALCLSLITALLGLAACGGGSGGVAATVNGTEIMEADVTERIEAVRAQDESYADDTAWAQALAGSSLTPESLRESNINAMAREIIISQEAQAQGYSVDDQAITDQIEQTKTTVGGDDESWLETLKQYGFKDEQAYRDMLVTYDLQTQLYEAFEIEVSDEDLISFIAENPGAVEGYVYGVGAVETPVDDATTGEGTEGEGTEEAPADDTATTDIPQPVDPSTVDLSTIPEDILTQFKEQWSTNNKGAQFNEWVEELVAAADIVINEMPADVSYNVDMSLAEGGSDGGDTGTDTGTDTPASSFSSEEAIQSALAEGLEITDDVVGEGEEAHDGDTVKVLYTGTLEDGTEFDSNQDSGIDVTLGTGGVIKGWDAGLVGMKVGGKRTLVIPPSLAYGDAGNGEKIPAGSTLYFEVELVEVTHNHE